MAVTGVNNYSNIYTNAYTGNIRKNNAKETTEKQVVEQSEDVKTGTTRKTAADELSYLSKKFDNYSFVSVSALSLVLPNTLSNPNWALISSDIRKAPSMLCIFSA